MTRWIFFAYSLLLLWLSSRPAADLPQLEIWDKGVHFMAYIPWGALLYKTLRGYGHFSNKLFILFFILMSLVFPALDEGSQYPIPGRIVSWGDYFANIIGCYVGLSIIWLFSRWQQRRSA